MEWQLTFKSDEEFDARIVSNAFRMQSDIVDILNLIRARIKYQTPSDEEIVLLDQIREILYKYEEL